MEQTTRNLVTFCLQPHSPQPLALAIRLMVKFEGHSALNHVYELICDDSRSVKWLFLLEPCVKILQGHITTLVLRDCDIGLEEIKTLSILCDDLPVTVLDLGCNRIQDEGSQYVAIFMQASLNLITLNLEYNGITQVGAQILAPVIAQHPTLCHLQLCGNQLRDGGALALAAILANHRVLLDLNLACNQIGREGGVAIARSLQSQRFLHKLDLHSNRIEDAGARALGRALCTNPGLTELNLMANDIQTEGIQALADALIRNTNLLKLSLGLMDLVRPAKDYINDAVAKYLAAALQQNATLQVLLLGYADIGIGPSGVLAFVQMLEINSAIIDLCLPFSSFKQKKN